MPYECPLSFEFFPPKTSEGENKLDDTVKQLRVLNPEFHSVTFGAGGSTRMKTYETVKHLKQDLNISVAPHLSCIDADKNSIKTMLLAYQGLGINRIVALRGDIPSGSMGIGEFKHASELVGFIRQILPEITIEVACYPEVHPESGRYQEDFKHFIEKVQAGANSAITQYFYNADAYFYFLDSLHKAQIDIPIIPGIMPITNFSRLIQFSKMCGAQIPQWLHKKLADFEDDIEGLKAFGIDFVSHLCENLLSQGAPGLHFYTLNDAHATKAICQNLKLGQHVNKTLSSRASRRW